METPKSLGFRMPAEWEWQESAWLAWPFNTETWPNLIEEVETSCIQLIKAIHSGQKINLLVNDNEMELYAKNKLKDANIGLSQIIFSKIKNVDAWMRDCGPIFVINDKSEEKAMVKWNFNAWGNKYKELKPDNEIPFEMNKTMKLQMFEPKIILEGGSIDVNGTGTLLTTEQCLLNKNRNPKLTKEEIEQYLKDYLNVSNIIWLKEGIIGDDTDGHIDDIARFVSQNTVVCCFEEDKNDENYEILKQNYELLLKMKDENGKKLNVVKFPMPGFVGDEKGRLPASYVNFYIGNKAVAVPTFGHENDKKATEILQKLFPARKVIGIDCKAMVYGLGTLHCRTQQEPKV
ncbi:agmatine deiminase family protein [Candidatus Woesearchaeota archaeon]|nr:agmatine deiminase family protein [Candidatus Woesearchaeota archaeon]